MARCTAWLGGLYVFTVLVAAQVPQRQKSKVRVDREVLGSVEDEVTLRCQLLTPSTNDGHNVTKVSWLREVNGQVQEVAVFESGFRPPYRVNGRLFFRSPFPFQDAALIIQSLRVTDEGIYHCKFILSNRTEEAQTRLIITVTPQNSAEAVPALAGETETVVALCTAANGKPPAEISWKTELFFNPNTTEIINTDGTITVHSQLRMIPSIQANSQMATCVINHKTATPANLVVVLSIQCPNGTAQTPRISQGPVWGSGVSVWVSIGLLGVMGLIYLVIMYVACQRSGSSQKNDMNRPDKPEDPELVVSSTML